MRIQFVALSWSDPLSNSCVYTLNKTTIVTTLIINSCWLNQKGACLVMGRSQVRFPQVPFLFLFFLHSTDTIPSQIDTFRVNLTPNKWLGKWLRIRVKSCDSEIRAAFTRKELTPSWRHFRVKFNTFRVIIDAAEIRKSFRKWRKINMRRNFYVFSWPSQLIIKGIKISKEKVSKRDAK